MGGYDLVGMIAVCAIFVLGVVVGELQSSHETHRRRIRRGRQSSPMARNRYYNTTHWRHLKLATHERDNWICTVPGCNSTKALVCDHIETRPNVDHPTELDVLSNTRTLCQLHDHQIKEGRDGRRMRSGKAKVVGCDASGRPSDPNHPWGQ